MINHGEKVPSKSTWVPLTSGPHFSGQLRMAAPPASSPCLLSSLCQGAQMFLLLVLSCLWLSMDGSIGQDYLEADAWFSGSSPVSFCLQVLVPRCSHWPVDGQLQPGTECAWVCARLCGRQQRQGGRGRGVEAVWYGGWLHGGWSQTIWALVPNQDSTRDCPMPLFSHL